MDIQEESEFNETMNLVKAVLERLEFHAFEDVLIWSNEHASKALLRCLKKTLSEFENGHLVLTSSYPKLEHFSVDSVARGLMTALDQAQERQDSLNREINELEDQLAKAQAVPEGFVLVEKSKIRTWYQDDDEPENFCNSESDLNCLGDCLDDDDIIAVNIHESAHISTRKVFGVWKSNSPTDIQSKFVLVDSRQEAEEIVASNKAMIEAQEPNND